MHDIKEDFRKETYMNTQSNYSISRPKRNVNIDAIKALSMIMVIILHATQYGIENADIINWTFPFWVVTISRSFSIVAVNVFVLISGYFSCKKVSNYKKLISLWLTVEFFSVGIYLFLALLTSTTVFNIKDLIKQALPVFTHQYWFFTYYLMLMIISPVLNDFIDNLSESRFKHYLIILLVIFSVAPSINIFGFGFGVNGGFGIVWFVVLYLIAAFFRMYPQNFKWGRLYIVSVGLLILVKLVGVFVPRLAVISKLLFQYNSVLVLAASVGLFCYAVNSSRIWNPLVGKSIIKTAAVSFGVYLLHEHGAFRNILWHEIVRLEDVAQQPVFFIIRFILSIVSIYIVGCLLNAIIQKILFLLPINKKSQQP